MREHLIMTPGPTYVHEEVRRELSREIINPDLDLQFYEFYKETANRIKNLLKTKSEVIIMSGEAILGLEAACASLIEPGDRVLCIENGIFGKGFGDFIKMYGGECVYFTGDYRSEINIDSLKDFLKKDNNFKLCTVVHCETPSGLINSIKDICSLLNSYGIISVVDAVSSIAGIDIETDLWGIDILLGGSQKCLSAPPGITFMSISNRAWKAIANRRKPIAGFYCNLGIWKNWYENKWFPYTQPVSDIYALRKAVDRALDDRSKYERHRIYGNAVRESLTKAGLELYPVNGFSDTVTTVLVPAAIDVNDILDLMLKKYNIMLAGAFDVLSGRVFRIGHMGENCREEKLYITLKALNNVLLELGVSLKESLHKNFINALSK